MKNEGLNCGFGLFRRSSVGRWLIRKTFRAGTHRSPWLISHILILLLLQPLEGIWLSPGRFDCCGPYQSCIVSGIDTRETVIDQIA